MADHANFNEDASNRTYKAPYTVNQPVPNVHDYGAIQGERQAQAFSSAKSQQEGSESKVHALIDAAKTHLRIHEHDEASSQEQLHSSQNPNARPLTPKGEGFRGQDHGDLGVIDSDRHVNQDDNEDTFGAPDSNGEKSNPRGKGNQRKQHNGPGLKTREVTDPITHLPVTIHDSTDHELSAVPENESHPDSSLTKKSEKQMREEYDQVKREHGGLLRRFPPPNFDAAREELATVYQRALLFGLGSLSLISLALMAAWLVAFSSTSRGHWGWQTTWPQALLHITMIAVPGLGIGGGIIWAVREWVGHRIEDIWESQVWEAARTEEKDTVDAPTAESTQWLNSILASVWALINPDLFAGLVDTLEDVMQASLPKLVRMVSVDDLGQGSEALRILGIKWLPTGAAAMDLSVNGKIKSDKERQSLRNVRGDCEKDRNNNLASTIRPDEEKNIDDSHSPEEDEQDQVAKGMEAEEGDFVNMEIAFSYRASSLGKSLKARSKCAHLYLAFYLPGRIRLRKFSEILIFRSTAGGEVCWSMSLIVRMLTFSSCLGRASRLHWHYETAPAVVSRPSFLLDLHFDFSRSTEGRFVVCPFDQTRPEHYESSYHIFLRAKFG